MNQSQTMLLSNPPLSQYNFNPELWISQHKLFFQFSTRRSVLYFVLQIQRTMYGAARTSCWHWCSPTLTLQTRCYNWQAGTVATDLSAANANAGAMRLPVHAAYCYQPLLKEEAKVPIKKHTRGNSDSKASIKNQQSAIISTEHNQQSSSLIRNAIWEKIAVVQFKGHISSRSSSNGVRQSSFNVTVKILQEQLILLPQASAISFQDQKGAYKH